MTLDRDPHRVRVGLIEVEEDGGGVDDGDVDRAVAAFVGEDEGDAEEVADEPGDAAGGSQEQLAGVGRDDVGRGGGGSESVDLLAGLLLGVLGAWRRRVMWSVASTSTTMRTRMRSPHLRQMVTSRAKTRARSLALPMRLGAGEDTGTSSSARRPTVRGCLASAGRGRLR